MADTASLYSTTTTLFDDSLPTLAANGEVGRGAIGSTSGGQTGADVLLPSKQCWAVLGLSQDHRLSDTALLTSCGLPSSYGRGSGNFSKFDPRKRLQIQFPLLHMVNDVVERAPIPANVEELRAMHGPVGHAHGRRRTLLELIYEDVVSVRTRKVTSGALRMIFFGPDARSATLFFPSDVLQQIPDWSQKSLASGDDHTSVKWATLVLTSPAVLGSEDTLTDKASRKAREKRAMEMMRQSASSEEEVLARMKQPSAANEELLDSVLLHLERRGAIWGKAGHICRPSTLNSDPTIRPQFIVMGLYPVAFLDRCKDYCGSGTSANGKNCMKAEADESSKSTRSPLITAAAQDLIGSSSNDKDAIDSDLLQGWHVKVTLEPFHSGSIKTAGQSVYGPMGGAVMGGI